MAALNWFKNHFVKCNQRAAMVKTWLPAPQDGPKSWLDQLVYDRALTLVRTIVLCTLFFCLHFFLSRRAERLPAKNSLIKLRAQMSVRNCTKNPFGVSMLSKTISYKRVTLSLTKIVPPSLSVCLSFYSVFPSKFSHEFLRDQTNEIASCAMPGSYGHERP